MSFTVEQRTRELGVRLALGAEQNDVARMVLRTGLRLTGLGVMAGLVGRAFSVHFLADMLYEVESTDLLTHGTVALLLTVVALASCYLPARKAARVNPVQALRHE